MYPDCVVRTKRTCWDLTPRIPGCTGGCCLAGVGLAVGVAVGKGVRVGVAVGVGVPRPPLHGSRPGSDASQPARTKAPRRRAAGTSSLRLAPEPSAARRFIEAVLALSDDPRPENVEEYLVASRALDDSRSRKEPRPRRAA